MSSTISHNPALAPAVGMPAHGSSFASVGQVACAGGVVRERLAGAKAGAMADATGAAMGTGVVIGAARAEAFALPTYLGSPSWSPPC